MEYRLSVDVAWREVRAKRHQPPGNASKGSRRLLFAAAMKQSEQFFRLAHQAGYETKPVLLYYGLNQAARAIVAVAASPGDPWELNGHGLTCPGLNQATILGDVQVVDQGKGKSFQMLAKYMNSPTLPATIEFRELWGSLPEGARVQLQGSENLFTAARLSVHAAERTDFGEAYTYISHIGLGPLPCDGYDRDDAEEVRRILHKRYPSLSDLKPHVYDGHAVARQYYGASRCSASLEFIDPRSAPASWEMSKRGPRIYTSWHDADPEGPDVWIIPTLAGNTAPMVPIVSWWAVLYLLSMLARYQPSAWTKMLDIDSSPDAPAVEYLLDEAHRICINLIVDALDTAAKFVVGGQSADQSQ